MPPKGSVGEVLRKHFGQEVADAMAAKIDKMVSEKKSAAQIERAFHADLSAQIEKELTAAIKAKVGTIPPSKVQPVQTEIKSKVGTMSVSIKVGQLLEPKVKATTQPSIKVQAVPPIHVSPGNPEPRHQVGLPATVVPSSLRKGPK
jgi:hypothetical protein